MSLNRSDERVLALAGLLQSCHLVTNLARTGLIGQDSLTGCLETVFVTNPDTTLDGDCGGLQALRTRRHVEVCNGRARRGKAAAE